MPAIVGHVSFDPDKEIPSLEEKVIFVTGGTAGIGASTVRHFAAHNASHIYFSGRNATAGAELISSLHTTYPHVGLTFVPMDLTSLSAVKKSLQTHFTHPRLDILVLNAGIMAQPRGLSADGYEIQFAVNHLGNAMVVSHLLPTLLATAKPPDRDVRVLFITSMGYKFHPLCGISFRELDNRSTMNRLLMGPWVRYGHSKLANVLSARELARRHPDIAAVAVHPGVVATELVHSQSFLNRCFIYGMNWLMGVELLKPEQGAWNTVWCAAAAKKEELRNGGLYIPVGEEISKGLTKMESSVELTKQLWEWTEAVMEKVEG